MALLTCALCGTPTTNPIERRGLVFCCHGCLQLYDVLGPEQIDLLKSKPGVNWTAVRNQSSESEPSSVAVAADTCTLQLDGLWCASCSILVETVLRRTEGIASATVDFATSSAEVSYDNEAVQLPDITQIIEKLGYGVKDAEHMVTSADKKLVHRFTIAAIVSLLDMMISLPVWFGYFSSFSPIVKWVFAGLLWALSTPVVFWAGFPFLRGAVSSIRHRIPTMDLLISLGSLAAYVYSFVSVFHGDSYLYFDTSSLLITFLLLSKSLEVGTKHRASFAVEMLSRSAPKTVVKLTEGREQLIAAEDLKVGDNFLVRSGDNVAADGRLVDGMSRFDESVLTGESIPSSKQKGDMVYTGTMCVNGYAIIEVTRLGDDTVLGQTKNAVKIAQETQNRRQKLVQRVLNVFVPVVLLIGLATCAADIFLLKLSIGTSILRSVSVWVIACPCSLSIAVPIVTAGTISYLSKLGFLLRNPDCLERAKNVDTVIFDKTGTLTQGSFLLSQMYPQNNQLLQTIASLEYSFQHPIARACVEAAERRNIDLLPVTESDVVTGQGVSGIVSDAKVTITAWDPSHKIPAAFENHALLWDKSGLTVSTVRINGIVKCVLAFGDEVRSTSRETVERVRQTGRNVIMLSGDSNSACQMVAQDLGIERWLARQSPLDKANFIEELQAQGRSVCFVGDGVNDAVALAQAEVGIALHSGNDIAIQAGDIILTRADLAPTVDALTLTQRASVILRQNLSWALIYNCVAVVVAVLGFASPAVAALAMALSSSVVLGNSLRIIGWNPLHYAKRLLIIVGGIAFFAGTAWLGL